MKKTPVSLTLSKLSSIISSRKLKLFFQGLQRTEKPYPSAGGLNGSLCGLTIWPIAINSDYVLELFSGSGDYSVAGDTKTG